MTTTIDDEHSLREKWTREQTELVERLVFEDHESSFSTDDLPDDVVAGTDYDVPIVRQEPVGTAQFEGLKFVGGLDISYVDDVAAQGYTGDTQLPDAFATAVILAFPSLELLHQVTVPIHLTTPYIPSFLSYREAPTYHTLLESLRTKLRDEGKEDEFPQLLLVDGNGRLHVREAGSACVVGFESGLPTIGVAKNYHPPHGTSEKSDSDGVHIPPESKWRDTQAGMRAMAQKVLLSPGSWIGLFHHQEDESGKPPTAVYIGAALRQPGTAKNPIFVSSGHKVSLTTAIRLTLALSRNTRVPEPIRKADFISREAVRAALRAK